MRAKIIIFFFLIVLFPGCQFQRDSDNERKYSSFNKTTTVNLSVISLDSIGYIGNSFLDIFDDILILTETNPSGEYGIHLFNKNNFEFITSTAKIGKGPGEVTRPGHLGVDNRNRKIWLTDHGKRLMWKFYIDSILLNSKYLPAENVNLHLDLFLVRFGILNDSILIGRAVKPIDNRTFEMANAKFNHFNESIEFFGYENPYAVGRRNSNSSFKVSLNNDVYVNAYLNLDLITICRLDGTLLVNIYGPNWPKKKDDKYSYYSGVDFYRDKIIAGYISDSAFIFDENKRPRGNFPTMFNVFDLKGNYIKTIETGHSFSYFCVDEDNSRVIAYFNALDPPIRYFNLDLD